MRANLFLSSVAAASALALGNPTLAERAPEIPQKPVSTEYHGVTVEDPYQWLENDEDPQVKAWSGAENQRTRKYLDGLPDRAAIEKQLTEWRENIAELFVARLATGNLVCDEIPATKTTAVAGDARVGR
jgi:protease II